MSITEVISPDYIQVMTGVALGVAATLAVTWVRQVDIAHAQQRINAFVRDEDQQDAAFLAEHKERFAIEADKPVDATVLDVKYPTQELRLAADADLPEVSPNVCPECRLLSAHKPLCSRPVSLPWELRALSDRPAADEDEVGDEQPGEAASRLLLPVLALARWWGYSLALGEHVAKRVWYFPTALGNGFARWVDEAVAYLRDRFKSNDALAAEWSTPADVEYAGRRRSDEASVNPAYRSRHTHPDFQTGIFPAINASIPAQRTDELCGHTYIGNVGEFTCNRYTHTDGQHWNSVAEFGWTDGEVQA